MPGESRGRNLLGHLLLNYHLAEYRGPFDESLERARQRGLRLYEYDRNLDALVGPNGYYGYEDYDEWREVGDPPVADPQARLDELARGTVRTSTGEREAPSDAMVDRLQNLGYVWAPPARWTTSHPGSVEWPNSASRSASSLGLESSVPGLLDRRENGGRNAVVTRFNIPLLAAPGVNDSPDLSP